MAKPAKGAVKAKKSVKDLRVKSAEVKGGSIIKKRDELQMSIIRKM